MACAAGTATIDEINRLKLTERSRKLGNVFSIYLKKIKKEHLNCVGYVTNKGLIGAIIFRNYNGVTAKNIASSVAMKCLKKGLLVVATNRDSIKLGPPLIISKKDLIKSMKILNTCIEEFLSENSKKH